MAQVLLLLLTEEEAGFMTFYLTVIQFTSLTNLVGQDQAIQALSMVNIWIEKLI